jgi:hypothetical protein
MPGRDVGGLEIFLLFLLGRDMLATDDGLGISSNSVAAAKTLEPCVCIGHGEADLEKHTIAPYLARQMSVDFVSQEHGVPHEGPKDSNAGGCTRKEACTKNINACNNIVAFYSCKYLCIDLTMIQLKGFAT